MNSPSKLIFTEVGQLPIFGLRAPFAPVPARLLMKVWWPVATLRTKDDQAAHPAPSPHAPDLAGLSLEPTPKATAPPIPLAPNSLMAPARPPRPPVSQFTAAKGDEDDDDDDPFSDDNVVRTPVEREELPW